jgi:hypothetical protein
MAAVRKGRLGAAAQDSGEVDRRAEDLTPVIVRFMVAADRAEALDSAAGYAAMRGLLAEAARLKMLIASPALLDVSPKPFPKALTTEEWLAAFGPDSIGAEA